jgi:gas vesicle protein
MSDREILLDKEESTKEEQAASPNNVETTINKGYNPAIIGLGAVFGALMGAAAAAFASKVTVENVNNTVKGVGDAVKNAAEGVNTTVKGVGNAVKNVAENVDYTLKDVGTSVKGTADEVNQNLKGTVDVVKSTAQNVNSTVKGTTDVIMSAKENMVQNVRNTVDTVGEAIPGAENQAASSTQKPTETQTAYILVPVDKDKYMMQNSSSGEMPMSSNPANPE